MDFKQKKTSRIFAAWLIATLVLWGCEPIYDDLRECRVSLQFEYGYNMAGVDRFALECNKVELFLFDSTGKLCYKNTVSGSELSKPGFKMEIPVSKGDYTAVAWVGRGNSYELSGTQPNISTKDNLTLKLLCTEGNIRKEIMEPLWHGQKAISFDGRADRMETVSLVRNSNTFNLTLSHPDAGTRAQASPEIKITATNGEYDSENIPCDGEDITYMPYSTTAEGEQFKASMKTLRLLDGKDIRLSVNDNGTSLLPTGDIDLVEYLLKTKPEGMTGQEYLDREHIWNMEIYYNQDWIAVLIKVNGWTVWTQGMEM